MKIILLLMAFIFPFKNKKPRCQKGPACVAFSMASMRQVETDIDDSETECCNQCNGTGFITHGDGHKTPCPCPDDCPCKANKPEEKEKKTTEVRYRKVCRNGRCYLEEIK